jgi:hypothetical protein
MRLERTQEPSLPARDDDISDRALAISDRALGIASYIALGLCGVCIVLGVVLKGAHIVEKLEHPRDAMPASTQTPAGPSG